MTLSDCEKETITSIWAKMSGNVKALGGEALERLFVCHAGSKSYFRHLNLSHGSEDINNQGGKILNAIGEATNHLDDLDEAFSKLSDLHAQKLKVDPGNFKLLSDCILVVLANHYPEEFTATAHSAWDKFITSASQVLVSKYR
ncbi:hemoglobin subunit alpha-5-like [Pelodytes ibericus]